MMRTLQELDKQWSIGVETVVRCQKKYFSNQFHYLLSINICLIFRAKSIRGYNTAAGKITHNKWQLGVISHQSTSSV